MNEIANFTFELDSKFTTSPPGIRIKHNSKLLQSDMLITGNTVLEIPISLSITDVADCKIELERFGFNGSDEQLLYIKQVKVDGIDLSRLMHLTKFYPEYPEPWISEQRDAGISWGAFHHGWLELGWNGIWKLDYKTPVYTWLLNNV